MFGLFGRSKKTIRSPKIIIASIGPDDAALVEGDREIYNGFFSDLDTISVNTIEEFYDAISNRACDIFHLLARVSPDHTIQSENGASFFRRLSSLDLKILILASENDADSLIPFCTEAPNAGVERVNMVMTLDRKGEVFVRFFKSLFGSMIGGMTMPEAWVQLVPQNPNMTHEAPDTVFSAGNGSLKLSV